MLRNITMKIEELVAIVTHSRKRTGIALLNPERNDFLTDFEKAGVHIVDLSNDFAGPVLLSDDAMHQLLIDQAIGRSTAYLNLELYIGPRFEEAQYLKYLLPKLLSSEPLKPIFFIFYSNVIYEKFKIYYLNSTFTSTHFYEEDFSDPSETFFGTEKAHR